MSALLVGYLAFIVTSVSPGPSVVAIMATSLSRGRAAGLRFAGGVVCGSCFWGLLAAAGVGALLESVGWALSALKIAGGLYLLWMAYKAGRSALCPDGPAAIPPSGRFWVRGLTLHLTNPKAVFGWISIVALGLPHDASVAHVLMLLGGCAALAVVVNLGYALIFSTPALVRAYASVRRVAEGVFAAFFGAAGIGLLTWRSP